MGTRFLATEESAAHANVKAAVVQLQDDGTCVTGRTAIGPTRAIKNRLTAMIIAAEKRGAPPEELFEMIGEGRSAKACVEGDCEDGSVYCGQIGGRIRTIKSAREVIEDVIAEAAAIVESFPSLLRA